MNRTNYHPEHHLEMLGLIFKGKNEDDVNEYAKNHFKELEKFNEQLSTVTI